MYSITSYLLKIQRHFICHLVDRAVTKGLAPWIFPIYYKHDPSASCTGNKTGTKKNSPPTCSNCIHPAPRNPDLYLGS